MKENYNSQPLSKMTISTSSASLKSPKPVSLSSTATTDYVFGPTASDFRQQIVKIFKNGLGIGPLETNIKNNDARRTRNFIFNLWLVQTFDRITLHHIEHSDDYEDFCEKVESMISENLEVEENMKDLLECIYNIHANTPSRGEKYQKTTEDAVACQGVVSSI